MTIGERILELVRSKGITQKEFSIKTGIPQSTISEWRGKKINPNSDKIMIICDVLDVEPAYVLTGVEGRKYGNVSYTPVYNDSDEYEVIMEFRELSSDNKKRLLGYLNALRDIQKK